MLLHHNVLHVMVRAIVPYSHLKYLLLSVYVRHGWTPRCFVCVTNVFVLSLQTEFIPQLKAIFAGKGTQRKNAGDGRVPLLYLDDADFQVWVQIEKEWLAGRLPDQWGREPAPHEVALNPRKPFVENDLKILHGMRNEDVSTVAQFIQNKKICVKSTNSKSEPATMMSMVDFCNTEKRLRVLKNELLFLIESKPLPSKKPEYIPYAAEDWDKFEREKNIDRSLMMSLLDKVQSSPGGEEFLKLRTNNLVKNPKDSDLPANIKTLLLSYARIKAAPVEQSPEELFSRTYKCQSFDWFRGDLNSSIQLQITRAWIDDRDLKLMIFCFCFAKVEGKTKARLMEGKRLIGIFDACEEFDEKRRIICVGAAIIVTDLDGMVEVVKEVQSRSARLNSQPWDYHVVHYIPQPDDDFPPSTIGQSYCVYLVFLFAKNPEMARRISFDHWMMTKKRATASNLDSVYRARLWKKDAVDREWRLPGEPSLNLSTAAQILDPFIREGVLLINVHGGPNITNIALVRF